MLHPEVLHPEVAAALAWSLPENPCQQPKLAGKSADIVDTQGIPSRMDVDSYKIDRFKRQEKRWLKCVANYKQGLVTDFSRLKDSAQYGLTQQQADKILAKLALIQASVEAPTYVTNMQ
ncbi:MAG: hypothetical protein QNL96_04045 [SAR86 cluster bacterium]|uniref:Uncharacterized protein n=1 Tax=SAR86 cluster bacterium TaxID=2030880 RepID=A0A973A896_9GAMM|nr:hypothetical protein [SAR86 cluster bacterium]